MDFGGKILVSRPSYQEQWFANSAIFVYEHTPNGAAGLILNKDSNLTVSDLLRHRDIMYTGNEPVYKGGPVNQQAIIMLHSNEWKSENTHQVNKDFSITSDISMMQLLASGNKPRQWRMFVGMSGWGPGQLEDEYMGEGVFDKKNSWLVTSATPALVYNYNGRDQWTKLVEQSGNEMFSQYF
jgi:putative transcriptional regulator